MAIGPCVADPCSIALSSVLLHRLNENRKEVTLNLGGLSNDCFVLNAWICIWNVSDKKLHAVESIYGKPTCRDAAAFVQSETL